MLVGYSGVQIRILVDIEIEDSREELDGEHCDRGWAIREATRGEGGVNKRGR